MALVASSVTNVAVENPVRHARSLFRVPGASVGLGATLVVLTLGTITLQSDVANRSDVGATGAEIPTAAGQAPLALRRDTPPPVGDAVSGPDDKRR